MRWLGSSSDIPPEESWFVDRFVIPSLVSHVDASKVVVDNLLIDTMPAYNNIILLLLLLLMSSSGEAVASPRSNWKSTSSLETRQSNPIATRYCNPATSICYLQYTWGPTIPVFRVAVPDSAVAGAPFDTLLQIVAPASLGWAGFAWGGRMTLNPLTVVWPNGNNVMVSSRWARSVYQQAVTWAEAPGLSSTPVPSPFRVFR